MAVTKQRTVYQYNPENGFIGATNSSHWAEDHPYLTLPNQVVSETPLKDADGNHVTGGFSFVLENGVPKKDANGSFVVMPPPEHIPEPTVMDYIFDAMLKNGMIRREDVHPDLLEQVNKSLNSIRK